MRTKKLTDLLLSCFSADELRRLVRWNWEGISASLPAGTASPAALAAAVVEELEKSALIDAAFFTTLRTERPRRSAEIDGVQRLWEAAGDSLTPARVDAPATVAVATVGSTASTGASTATSSSFPYDIFLAHAGPDLATADKLFQLLVAHPAASPLAVFLDARSLELGQAWDVELPRALRRSRLIVVLVSDRVEKAWYLRTEIAEAINLTRQEGAAQRVIPVFVDGPPGPTSEVPYGLRQLHGLSLPQAGLEGAARQIAALALKLRDLTA